MKKIKRVTFQIFTFLFLPGVLFLLNVWLVYPLFQGEYTKFLQSIEVSYITMGRFLFDYWPHLSWNPYWYSGFPFHLFYTPLLPVLEALLHAIFSISVQRTYRLITGFSYCFVPTSLYFFTLKLTKKKSAALIAAFAYSLMPSVAYFISEVRGIGEGFAFAPWRLIILVLYGEGPHTMSLVFLPLAGAGFLQLLEKRIFIWGIITSLLVALVGLTNAIGFFALTLLFLVIAFCEIMLVKQAESERIDKIKVGLWVAILSYGFLAFWYNFSFIKSFFTEGGGILDNYLAIFPWGCVFLIWLVALVYFVFSRLVKTQELRIALLWFLTCGFIVFAHYQWGIDYAPQALRYITEVDMAAAILLGIVIAEVSSKLWKAKSFLLKPLSLVLVIAALVGIIFASQNFLGLAERHIVLFSRKFTQPGQDLEKSAEFEISQWLRDNTEDGRVYISGNYAFWLNYFVDVPQLRGALDQAATHPWWDHANYQIYHDKNAEISIAWAKIFNLTHLVVNTSTSRNPYKDFLYPDKFEGLLERVFEKKGDIIYRVPLKNESLAQVVDLSRVSDLTIPENAVDKKPIFDYVDWLEEKSSQLVFKRVNNDHYVISGSVEEGEGILVQMTYDNGWRVEDEGKKLKILKDPLGFMVIKPLRSGDFKIKLVHGATFDQYLGYLLTLISVLSVIILSFTHVRGKLKKIAVEPLEREKSEDLFESDNDAGLA